MVSECRQNSVRVFDEQVVVAECCFSRMPDATAVEEVRNPPEKTKWEKIIIICETVLPVCAKISGATTKTRRTKGRVVHIA